MPLSFQWFGTDHILVCPSWSVQFHACIDASYWSMQSAGARYCSLSNRRHSFGSIVCVTSCNCLSASIVALRRCFNNCHRISIVNSVSSFVDVHCCTWRATACCWQGRNAKRRTAVKLMKLGWSLWCIVLRFFIPRNTCTWRILSQWHHDGYKLICIEKNCHLG
jgi:hypothetical protein